MSMLRSNSAILFAGVRSPDARTNRSVVSRKRRGTRLTRCFFIMAARPESLAVGQAVKAGWIFVNKDLATRKSFQKRVSLQLVARLNVEVQAVGR